MTLTLKCLPHIRSNTADASRILGQRIRSSGATPRPISNPLTFICIVHSTDRANSLPPPIAFPPPSTFDLPSSLQVRTLGVTRRTPFRPNCLLLGPPTPFNSSFGVLLNRHFKPRYISTMSTPSLPQTPATLESPLREHRHKPVERLTDDLETPSLDDRSYRVVKLPNQLEVLLVHDAETDKASAAMDVNVGNFSDADDMPGMAHAVEHCTYFLSARAMANMIQCSLWEPGR